MRYRAIAGALLGAVGAACACLPALAQTSDWPSRPIKWVVGFAPGGATDIVARLMAAKYQEILKQPVIVENRAGAGGNTGADAVAKSPPDGYTFLLTPNSAIAIVPMLRKAPYDATTQLDPVARVGDIIGGFVVHPSVGVKTMKELIAYAKANAGKLTFGSAGLATSTHLRIEMLKLRAGVNILHVPYRGSAATKSRNIPAKTQRPQRSESRGKNYS